MLNTKRNWKKQLLPLTIIVIGFLFILTQVLTNINAYLKAAFTRVDYPSEYQFAVYNQILNKYVHDGLVNYKGLSESAELNKAVDELAGISPEHFADNNQKLAFWINTYNLLILKSVVNHYPLKERSPLIRDLSLRKFVVGGQSIATDDIRTTKIYPLIDLKEPRSIFLTCGGALGYPKLLNHVISKETMDADMTESTNEFINRPGNLIYREGSGTLFISQFFKWNEALFSPTPFVYVNNLLPKQKRVDFDDYHTKTSYLGLFNWTLNEEVSN